MLADLSTDVSMTKDARPENNESATDRLAPRLLAVIASIPRGDWCSYGEVARRAGLPGYHRLVARLLAHLPRGSKLPWHRVLKADGRPGMAEGSPGWREQLQRLRAEGVRVENGRACRPGQP